ncbi:trypsin-like serine protease [Staphylococcus hominis]|uniref:trypsin-like serine protease n=1 Tax=Staphylococcus hominis TaxID=1290 RepID=UPI003DA0EF37
MNKKYLLSIAASVVVTFTGIQQHTAQAKNQSIIPYNINHYEQNVGNKFPLIKHINRDFKPSSMLLPNDNLLDDYYKESIEASDNYYNLPMRYSGINTPSGTTYDFGATSRASGVFDAIRYSKEVGNSMLSIEEQKGANITFVSADDNKNNKTNKGTASAIGKHTLITNEHVVDEFNADSPHTPLPIEDITIQPKRYKTEIAEKLEVTSVTPIKQGDVALIHTKEDLTQYMDIVPLANENDIKHMKSNDSIHMYHYSNLLKSDYPPRDLLKTYIMATPYVSKGAYIMRSRNTHPIIYFKMIASKGGSGSLILNDKGQAIGIYSNTLNSPIASKFNTKIGFALTDDLRKEIDRHNN